MTLRRRSALHRHCERSEAIQCGGAVLDCFVAELVIGPATSGRTRWLLAMTMDGIGLTSSCPRPLPWQRTGMPRPRTVAEFRFPMDGFPPKSDQSPGRYGLL